jgi:hypothetical protein
MDSARIRLPIGEPDFDVKDPAGPLASINVHNGRQGQR